MQISRHLNYTGRRKIKHSEVEIELVEQNNRPPSFLANFNLDTNDIPANADLYVEAYHKNTSQRFNFGTVTQPKPPSDTTLDQIDLSGPTLFRVKVVENSGEAGKLIASVERLTPKDDDLEEQRSSLMIFKSVPEMGNLTWKITFNEDHKPVLCINNKIPEAKNQLLHNPVFQSLILPAAFREVLMYISWDQEGEADEDSWQRQWIEFANNVGIEDCPNEDDPDLMHNWINEVVAAFSDVHHFCDHLIKRMEEQHYA